MEENNASLNIEAIMDGIRDEIRQEQAASLNVEQIVAEIRAQVNGKPKPAIPDFSEVQAAPTLSAAPAPAPAASAADGGVRRQICNEAQYLKGNSYNPYYQELGAGLKAFVKRVIRRLNRCVVLPLNERQNAFNLHAAFARLFSDNTVQQLFAVLLLSALPDVFLLPMRYYDTMRIEEKYGFNRTSKKTFWLDQLKSFLIGLALILLGIFVYSVNIA